jgi:hypothetical protein
MDDETRSLLQSTVASELGLPASMSSRIRGDSASSMRDDGRALAQELGISPPAEGRARGGDGRFVGVVDMSSAIRRAAGRG